MPNPRRLNLDAIEASLRAVQADFDAINASLTISRDPLTDEVVERLMLGYAYVDRLLARRIDAFELGNSPFLLELNYLVLCGTDAAIRLDCRQVLELTQQRFYTASGGGIEGLVNWLQARKGDAAWKQAAGAYVYILSQPQLYFEGNHRTGALVMSYLLARNGRPPFVLSVDNAKAYFDPSTLVKNARKHTLQLLLARPKLVKRFAAILKNGGEKVHLGSVF